jgi:hypothetical protein
MQESGEHPHADGSRETERRLNKAWHTILCRQVEFRIEGRGREAVLQLTESRVLNSQRTPSTSIEYCISCRDTRAENREQAESRLLINSHRRAESKCSTFVCEFRRHRVDASDEEFGPMSHATHILSGQLLIIA